MAERSTIIAGLGILLRGMDELALRGQMPVQEARNRAVTLRAAWRELRSQLDKTTAQQPKLPIDSAPPG
jgi:hypothetical protein